MIEGEPLHYYAWTEPHLSRVQKISDFKTDGRNNFVWFNAYLISPCCWNFLSSNVPYSKSSTIKKRNENKINCKKQILWWPLNFMRIFSFFLMFLCSALPPRRSNKPRLKKFPDSGKWFTTLNKTKTRREVEIQFDKKSLSKKVKIKCCWIKNKTIRLKKRNLFLIFNTVNVTIGNAYCKGPVY